MEQASLQQAKEAHQEHLRMSRELDLERQLKKKLLKQKQRELDTDGRVVHHLRHSKKSSGVPEIQATNRHEEHLEQIQVAGLIPPPPPRGQRHAQQPVSGTADPRSSETGQVIR